MDLVRAFVLDTNNLRKVQLAFVGAGGKTSAILSIAKSLPKPVFITTTTHVGNWQLRDLDDVHEIHQHPDLTNALKGDLKGIHGFFGPLKSDDRLTSLPDVELDFLSSFAKDAGIPLLIEADGSRRLPLKAPGAHEPVIPGFVDGVVVTAGLSGLHQPITDEHVFRPKIFSKLSGSVEGEDVTGNGLIRYLLHPEGGLKGIPRDARKMVLMNQVNTPDLIQAADKMALPLLEKYHRVIVGEQIQPESKEISILRTRTSVGGIILAAGESKRFGEPKHLLDWKGKPIIQHIIEAALESDLSSISVVTGKYHKATIETLPELPINFIHNKNWHLGQSSSVKIGLENLDPNISGVVFFLADQPLIRSDLINTILDAYASTLNPIIVPYVKGERGNPVLFDKALFSELKDIKGDKGGRSLFVKYPIEKVEWDDRSPLVDIDSPEDYKNLQDSVQ